MHVKALEHGVCTQPPCSGRPEATAVGLVSLGGATRCAASRGGKGEGSATGAATATTALAACGPDAVTAALIEVREAEGRVGWGLSNHCPVCAVAHLLQ